MSVVVFCVVEASDGADEGDGGGGEVAGGASGGLCPIV